MKLKRTLRALQVFSRAKAVQSSLTYFVQCVICIGKQNCCSGRGLLKKGAIPISKGIATFLPLLYPISAFSMSESESDYSFLNTKVFAPALMDQSITDTPGAVTVITSAQIQDLGLKSLADVMKLVPGFSISHGPFYGINRGPNYPTARRLQVLIDGISEVNPLVGIVRWENIPVAIENIERVEVLRSQASATYGANAFYGAINIITKNPLDVIGTTFSGYSTTDGKEWSGFARHASNLGRTSVMFEYRNSYFDHYDTFDDSNSERHDDQSIQFAKMRTLTRTSSGDKIGFSIAGTSAETHHDLGQTIYGIDYPIAKMDTMLASFDYSITTENHVISMNGSANDKDWDYHWNVCAPKAFFYPKLGELYRENPDLILSVLSGSIPREATISQISRAYEIYSELSVDPDSFSNVCGRTEIDYHHRTYTGSLSDLWQISETIRLSSYLQFDYRWIDSVTYGNGKTTLKKSKFFTNAEIVPSDMATINIGMFVESIGYDFANPQISPRVGITFHLDDKSSVKYVFSIGKRLIDGIEIIDYNQAPTYFDTPVYGSRMQSAFLTYSPLYQDRDHVETITSNEINYYYADGSIEFEARYYTEHLTDILNYQDLISIPNTDFFREGLEFAFNLAISDATLGGSIFYMNSSSNQKEAYNDFNYTGGSIYIVKPLPLGLLGSIGYYSTSPISFSTGETIANNSRLDFRIARKFGICDLEVMLRQQNDGYNYGSYTGGSPDSGKRDSNTELLVGINASF